MEREFFLFLEEHVDLLPSDRNLAAAMARTVGWSVGSGCSLGRVFLDVFGEPVSLLPSGHDLAATAVTRTVSWNVDRG